MGATYTHRFRSKDAETSARKYLPRLSRSGLTPRVFEWFDGGIVTEEGVPLRDWTASASDDAVQAMRPRMIAVVRQLHQEGVCHRDLHWGNVILVQDEPLLIDFEHACDVAPEWPCYDLTGPSSEVPLLEAHSRFGGVLGTQGIWWDAEVDEAFRGMKRPGFDGGCCY